MTDASTNAAPTNAAPTNAVPEASAGTSGARPRSPSLAEHRVLIAEDEALIALDLEMVIADTGAEVVGPFARLDDVLEAIEAEGARISVALLDIMLGREEVYPAAERLRALGVPFAFHSGHAVTTETEADFPGVPLCRKPATDKEVVRVLAGLL